MRNGLQKLMHDFVTGILSLKMFSKTSEYALRAVIYIAQKSSEQYKLGIEEIATAIKSPKHFTAKILQQLTAGNKLVSSVRGPNGGFYMTDKAKNKPVIEILRLLGEDIILDKCILGLNECSDKTPCPLHSQYKHIKPQLLEMFKSKKITDLTSEIQLGKALKNFNLKK